MNQYSYDYQTDSDDSDSDDSDMSLLMDEVDEAERTLEPGACETQAGETQEGARQSSLLASLEDSCWKRRIEALKILSEDPSVTSYAGHIIPKLADTSYPVCCEAMATLAKFHPKVLAEYAPEHILPMLDHCQSQRLSDDELKALRETFNKRWLALFEPEDPIRMVYDENSYMRVEALRTLSKIDPDELVKYFDRVIAKLGDKEGAVRWHTFLTVSKLKPRVVEMYVEQIIPFLNDGDEDVRFAALDLMGRLEPRVIAKAVNSTIARLCDLGGGVMGSVGSLDTLVIWIISRLDDDDRDVRKGAFSLFRSLQPGVIAKYVEELITKKTNVRLQTLLTLGKLDPGVLARYAPHIVPMLEDAEETVRVAALLLLKKMPLLALVPHRAALPCAAVASLRGGVWLLRWRQLFWAERLLWWWASRAWAPGTAQAAVLADEYGCIHRCVRKRLRSA